MGEIYQSQVRPEKAAEAYRAALERSPLESMPLVALGHLEWGQGREKTAMDSFRMAVETTPGWGPAHLAYGNALWVRGNLEEAANHYKVAQLTSGHLVEGVVFDFLSQFAESEVVAPRPEYVRIDTFNISGDARNVLFQHPDSRVTYTLEVDESTWLSFGVATNPESWTMPGDGVWFALDVERGKERTRIFEAYIDPKNHQNDRRWQSHWIDMAGYAGQRVNLVFETGSGPDGDFRYDWAGWGEPRLWVRS
jgi:tetratricopeptide (TPR) repeat protein